MCFNTFSYFPESTCISTSFICLLSKSFVIFYLSNRYSYYNIYLIICSIKGYCSFYELILPIYFLSALQTTLQFHSASRNSVVLIKSLQKMIVFFFLLTLIHFLSFFLSFHSFFFFEDFIYLFLESGREGEREGDKYQCVVALRARPPPPLETWPATQACALTGKLNQQPFDSQAGTQSTEPHQPGLFLSYKIKTFSKMFQSDSIKVYIPLVMLILNRE